MAWYEEQEVAPISKVGIPLGGEPSFITGGSLGREPLAGAAQFLKPLIKAISALFVGYKNLPTTRIEATFKFFINWVSKNGNGKVVLNSNNLSWVSLWYTKYLAPTLLQKFL